MTAQLSPHYQESSTLTLYPDPHAHEAAMHIQASPPNSDTAKISVKIKPIASSLLGADAPGNGKPTAKKPTLLASYAAAKEVASSEPSAAAARYRSLDPAGWRVVVDDVGGLDEVLESIRRRIWVPLCAPRSLLDELGGEPVKGLLLHGPPGCGKSYLAARLAYGLSRRPPTIVSGPEVMDKWIGSSEAALRALFVQAPPVPAKPSGSGEVEIAAENNELHVIVLDEFDAIARSRSSGKVGNAGTAFRDSVVNQLLALMDGVVSLPVPTFVIALTNQRELIDPAVLRPGRCPSLLTTHLPLRGMCPSLSHCPRADPLAQDDSRCKLHWAHRTTTGVRRS